MSLISKTAKIKWHSKTKKWYESKGYKFTKYGDEFEVKIEDITRGSNIKIDIQCDGCGKKIRMYIYNYMRNINSYNKKNYCKKCYLSLFNSEKIKNKRLKSGKSFEQWCIENDRQDILDKWDYELNKQNPNEICYGTTDKYFFKCHRKLHKSELKNINNITINKNHNFQCKACNSIGQYILDTYGENGLEKYWDYEKNDKLNIDPFEIGYASHKKIWIKCQKKDYHNSYLISSNEFLRGNRCPYCSGHKVHPLDSLGQYIIDNYGENFLDKIWSDKNKKSPFEYAPMGTQKVWWNCSNNKHKNYYREISNSTICEFRCPKCVQERRESILQEKVRKYLESLGYDILHENKCTLILINPKTKYPLPFDNEITLQNGKHLLCEVNGIQHYRITRFHYLSAKHNGTTPEYELHYQQLKDRYKKFIAHIYGYEYLEIPYWTDNENETWKKLIDDKLNKIEQKIY